MKTLNVVKTNLDELEEHWGFYPGLLNPNVERFIRCNRKGQINWDKAPVYSWAEIQEEQKKRRVCFLVPKEQFSI